MKWLSPVCLAAALLAVLACCPPRFYRQAERARRGGPESKRFVRQLADLWNAIENEPTWQGQFSQKAINRWLAGDFALKHAALLPKRLKGPRIALEPGRVEAGVQWRVGPLATVLSARTRLWVPQANTIAVAFERVRLGLLPLPCRSAIPLLKPMLAASQLDTAWRRYRGRPVLLVRFGSSGQDGGGPQLQQIQVRRGLLVVAGHSPR